MSGADPQPPREPKYYLVKRHLVAAIQSLDPGTAVPTERVLSAQFGTSRATVRQAVQDLVAEGRLVRRQGSGTYVAEPKLTWPLQLAGFTEQAVEGGFTPSTQLLAAERIRAVEGVAARLRIRVGDPVFRVERLRLADERPMAVETSHLPARRFPRLVSHMQRATSLYAVLKDVYRVVAASAEESISTAPASPREADLLKTDTGAPMLVLGRHTFDADDEPIEWVTSWYRGDRVTFVAELLPRK
ncbi:MAG TPA: GntR family transcriptional regulator [Jatrophihabitans sp.]|nr:GntR family transcriptional regulator [Jatrophihabitans sp.]